MAIPENTNTIKKRTLSLHREGDFYEFRDNDALEASSALNLTLSGRKSAGFPCHALKRYQTRLRLAGYTLREVDNG